MGCEAATRDDPVVGTAVAEASERHLSAGREFEAAGIESFILEHGEGDPVVLMHGIPPGGSAPAVADAIVGLATSA